MTCPPGQRFDAVAEAHNQSRPGYPTSLVDRLSHRATGGLSITVIMETGGTAVGRAAHLALSRVSNRRVCGMGVETTLRIGAATSAACCWLTFQVHTTTSRIFLTGAAELGVAPEHRFVVEDASSGVEAAKAGTMAALGVARADDEQLLAAANADLVVTLLDEVDVAGLAQHQLRQRTS